MWHLVIKRKTCNLVGPQKRVGIKMHEYFPNTNTITDTSIPFPGLHLLNSCRPGGTWRLSAGSAVYPHDSLAWSKTWIPSAWSHSGTLYSEKCLCLINTVRVLPALAIIPSMWHHQNIITGWQTFFYCCWAVNIFFLFLSGDFISPIVVDKWVSGCGLRVWAQGGHAVVHKDPEGDVASSKDGRLHLDDVIQEVHTGRPGPLPVLCPVGGIGRVVKVRLAQWILIPVVQ